jgi:hypothetical protein
VTKLGDFGMALGPAEVRIGNANVRVGTPYYTAPEIWRGEAATPASDIYSLGATYFHLLTGRPPYASPDVPAVEQAHLRAPIPDPRELVPALPASCTALVQRALAKAPRERHASAQELLWEARRVLQDLPPGAPPPPPARAPRREATAEPARSAPPPASGPLADVLGFVRRPFGHVDLVASPQLAEPLAAARGGLLERLREDGATLVALCGPEGSGAGALCRALVAELGRARLVLRLDVGQGSEARGLLQRLCAAAAAEDAPRDLEGLVALLGEERRRQGAPSLVVLEGVTVPHPSMAGIAAIVEAAQWTRSFQLVLSGGPALVDRLAAAGLDLRGERIPEVEVAALDRAQLARHLRAWIEATLAPHAPPLLVTPDALCLVGLRSEGALERVNCIAENMLLLAAAERRRVLSSWHAWAAPDRERWAERRGAVLPQRPQAWPPPEVVDVIDACRRAAGMPPWPRGSQPR